MLDEAEKWINSRVNIFKKYGCDFDVVTPPSDAPAKSITLDFEITNKMCRIIFWETGFGHVEAINIDTEEVILDESFDPKEELNRQAPFQFLFDRVVNSSS